MKDYKRELLKTAREFSAGLLDNKSSDNMCFAVSSALGSYLHFLGYDVKLQKAVINCNDAEIEHYYLVLPDGLILDCTADQFNKTLGKKMPRVYIGKKPDWYMEIPKI